MPEANNQPSILTDVITHRPSRLFIILAGFFVANALVAELIGVKKIALEDSPVHF